MDNRRAFSRHDVNLMVVFETSTLKSVGEIRNIGIGGLRARIPKKDFTVGELVEVYPQGEEALQYQVSWAEESGGGTDLGLVFPASVAKFWHSWAADLLAGARPTNGEVLERRRQVRLECLLPATLSHKGSDFQARVLDLGGGGALIEMEESLQEGSSVILTVDKPVRIGQLPCELVRAWPSDPFRYGLSFSNLKERHRLALVRLLDMLL